MNNPMEHFSSLTDPRVDRTKEHILEDIIFITIAAVICGCENWNEIKSYGESKQEWLLGILRLPSVSPPMIPSTGYLLPYTHWSLKPAFWKG